MLIGLALMLAAAPPPPTLLPKTLAGPVEGYDLSDTYQVWRWWVEEQKGAATELLLAQPEVIAGEEAYGAPLLRFQKYNDFGHFLTGEIRLIAALAKMIVTSRKAATIAFVAPM